MSVRFTNIFLDAPSHLYKRSCPSVGPSVDPALFSKVKSTHIRRILCRVSGLDLFMSIFQLNPLRSLRTGLEIIKGWVICPIFLGNVFLNFYVYSKPSCGLSDNVVKNTYTRPPVKFRFILFPFCWFR